MERKVARAQGDRSQEEIKQLDQDISKLKVDFDNKLSEFHTLNTSNKQLIDEIRTVERLVNKVLQDKAHLEVQIQELELENDMSLNDLEKIKRKKEDTLVQHDIIKLEIKKL